MSAAVSGFDLNSFVQIGHPAQGFAKGALEKTAVVTILS